MTGNTRKPSPGTTSLYYQAYPQISLIFPLVFCISPQDIGENTLTIQHFHLESLHLYSLTLVSRPALNGSCMAEPLVMINECQ